jgi:hypothetical protein
MMKKIITIILLMILTTLARADFLGFYDDGNEGADDSVWVYISMWDSLALKTAVPDTVFIFRFGPDGDTITADTIATLSSYNYGDGFYMKHYRAGDQPGQYTVHAYGSKNGNYFSIADHNYFVSGNAINELSSNAIGAIADSCRELFWRTGLSPGYPSQGDTASAVILRILADVDGDGVSGIDADIGNLNDIDSLGVYRAVLSALMADSAVVDTGDGSYAHATVKAGSIPDSLLASVTKIDSIHAWVGSPYESTAVPSLHMKIGLGYSGAAGDGNIKDQLDTVKVYVGKHGQTTQGFVSLHNKLGSYSGLAGVGNNVHDDLEIVASQGGGTEPETLLVLSLADSSKIQGARACLRTIDQSTIRAAGLLTDNNGRLILALDPDSFWVEITANGYNQTLDTIIVDDGGGTDTLYMSRFDPGSPSEPGLCRVYGWVYDITGDSLAGIEVTAEIPREYHPVKYNNVVITPFSKSSTTDSSGYWQIDLIPSSSLSGDEVKYLFTVKNDSGVIYRIKVEVPQYSSWQLQ